MRSSVLCGLGVLSTVGVLVAVAGCSSSTDSCRQAPACAGADAVNAAQAGAAGEADATGSAAVVTAGSEAGAAGAEACKRDSDCDDGVACNGVESCQQGQCARGAPPPTSENGISCTQTNADAPRTYPANLGPWLVYTADEDIPGSDELYAVREGLIGTQAPVKLNPTLSPAHGESIGLSGTWSADRAWFAFSLETPATSRQFVQHFGPGLPDAPVEVAASVSGKSYALWSPTGDDLLIAPSGAASDVYVVRLDRGVFSAPRKLNLDGQAVTAAAWVEQGQAVVFTTTDGDEYAITLDGPQPSTPVLFGGVAGAQFADVSPDGAWIMLLTSVNGTAGYSLARAQPGSVAQPLNQPGIDSSDIAFRWSPDSHYLAYGASEQVQGQSEVYLLDLRNALSRTTVEQGQVLSPNSSLGDWTADSKNLLFYGADTANSELKTVQVWNTASAQAASTPYEIGFRDRELGFDVKSSWVLFGTQRVPTEPAQLTALDLTPSYYSDSPLEASHYDGSGIAAAPQGLTYAELGVAADDSALLLCTSVDDDTNDDYDMYYLDMRNSPGLYPPVRVPGVGPSSQCYAAFAPDAKGFVYFRSAPDGAKTLYWVDASKQVLGAPVAITRAGRARSYVWQPR